MAVSIFVIIYNFLFFFILVGHGRGPVLDSACDLLPPDRRPIPPQPNCPQSMKIYEEHMKVP